MLVPQSSIRVHSTNNWYEYDGWYCHHWLTHLTFLCNIFLKTFLRQYFAIPIPFYINGKILPVNRAGQSCLVPVEKNMPNRLEFCFQLWKAKTLMEKLLPLPLNKITVHNAKSSYIVNKSRVCYKDHIHLEELRWIAIQAISSFCGFYPGAKWSPLGLEWRTCG